MYEALQSKPKRHTHILYIVVSTTQFPPWERAYSGRGGYHLSAWAYESIHRKEQRRHVSHLWCKLQGCVFFRASPVSALMSALARRMSPGVEQADTGQQLTSAPLWSSPASPRGWHGLLLSLISPHTYWWCLFLPLNSNPAEDGSQGGNYLTPLPNIGSYHGCVVCYCSCKIAKLTWGNHIQSPNMWRAASCCHCWLVFPCRFSVQYATWPAYSCSRFECSHSHPLTWPTDCTFHIAVGHAGERQGQEGGLCWSSSARRGCSQLLISVFTGLYRPEVRIQCSRLSCTAPLPAPEPVNPSHLVSTEHTALQSAVSGRHLVVTVMQLHQDWHQ